MEAVYLWRRAPRSLLPVVMMKDLEIPPCLTTTPPIRNLGSYKWVETEKKSNLSNQLNQTQIGLLLLDVILYYFYLLNFQRRNDSNGGSSSDDQRTSGHASMSDGHISSSPTTDRHHHYTPPLYSLPENER